MKKAHVSIILDKSGSMASVREATLSGLNEYLSTLRKDTEVDYTIDLTLFDTSVFKRISGKSLKEIEGITDYSPDGMTALYDAVCDTIKSREGAGEKWIVVVMTDGEENSSKRYNQNDLSNMVHALKATGNVTFAFLGANQDSWATAGKWGFDKGNVANYKATDLGTQSAFRGMGMATSATANSAQMSSKNFFETRVNEKGDLLDWDAKDGK